MKDIFNKLMQNKHTSAAAIVALVGLGLHILKFWFPSYQVQLEETAREIQGFALSYGLLLSVDAKSNTQDKQ